MEPTAIDLFCGAGGLSLGLRTAGFRILGALDYWDRAVRTYEENFDHPVVLRDIRSTSTHELLSLINQDGKEIDLLAGGPPCQGFSVQRIGQNDDSRNDLIFEFARFVCGLRPKMFLMENVPGLVGARGISYAKRFESLVSQSGYECEWVLLNAAEYGLPQMRKRVFYYGWLNSEVSAFQFPSPTCREGEFRSAWEAINDLPSATKPGDLHGEDRLHRETRLSDLNVERIRLIPPGGGFEDLPAHLRVDCHKNGAAKIGHRYVYGRLHPDRPAPTITARFDSFTRGKFGHPHEHRTITLREGARFQSFPDSFKFVGTQEQIAALIGNAIPPHIGNLIGSAFYQHLTSPSEQAMLEQFQLQLF
jgi:DNA (cytosine-5)-methyltransferase 1